MADLTRAMLVILALSGCARQRALEPAAEPSPTPELRATCCSQCRAAASTDPSAMDLSLVPCADYAGRIVNRASVLDAACASWFAESGLMVQDCR